MKSTLKLLSLLFIVLFTVSSCSKEDDPTDNDLFVGTYEGDTGYSDLGDDSNNIDYGPGKVVVAKVGDSYSFKFDNDIPDLNNIKMEKGDNNTIFFGDGELGTITISESTLSIAYTADQKIWNADCSR